LGQWRTDGSACVGRNSRRLMPPHKKFNALWIFADGIATASPNVANGIKWSVRRCRLWVKKHQFDLPLSPFPVASIADIASRPITPPYMSGIGAFVGALCRAP
jgi:hypothetical protein